MGDRGLQTIPACFATFGAVLAIFETLATTPTAFGTILATMATIPTSVASIPATFETDTTDGGRGSAISRHNR